MAGQESLGDAVLYLTVNDEALRQGIGKAKEFVRKELGQAFSAGTGGGRRGGGGFGDQLKSTRIISRRLGDDLQRLADRGVNVTKQFNQLNKAVTAAQRGQTQTARAYNKTVADFIRQENRAYRAVQRRQRLSAAGVSPARSDIRGSLRQPGSPLFTARGARLGGAREDIDARFKAQKRRYSLDQQIRSLEVAGVKTDKFRESLGKITFAQKRREFGLAKQLSNQLSFDLRKERDRLRVRQQQSATAARDLRRSQQIGGARSPIGGASFIPGSPAAIAVAARAGGPRTSVRGSVDIPGSPEWIEAYQRNIDKAARAGGARSSIRGSVDIPGSPAFIEAQQREIAKSAKTGGPTSPIRGSKDIPGSPAFIEEQTRQYNEEISKAARAGGARSPIRGTKDIPGSPAFIAEQARRRAIRRRNLEGRISSGLVGGAFPLLFGQGAGAAIGGGLGGLAGGSKFGFGLSLVGTVLGSAFDEAINKAKTLAAALDDPISNFAALTESALLSSRAVEKQAKALIDSGRAAEASALILQDLSARFGDAGNAKELLDATDTINRQWSELSTTLGILSAGPLSNLADLFTRLLGPAQAQLAFEQRVTGLKPEQAAEARKFRESELQKLPSFANEEQYKQVDIRALQFIEERFGKSKAQLDIENKIKTSKATQLGIDSARVAIAREEDRILSLQLQKRQAQLEEEKALQALGNTPAQAAVDKIKLDTKVKLLEIERQISEEVNRRDEKQKKAAQDLQNLRLQNIKFLGRGEKQALIKQVGQPAIQEAQRRGVTLRSFSDIRDFAQFLERERTLQNEAGPELINSNQDLRTSLESTADVIQGLVSSVDTLSNKEWNITVTVPGQNSSQKQDLVNSLG